MRAAVLRLLNADASTARIVMGGIALAFAAILLLDTTAVRNTTTATALGRTGVPLWAWGLIWAWVGLGQVAGSLRFGQVQVADTLAAVIWLFWSALVYQAAGWTTVPVTYFWIAVCCLAAARRGVRNGHYVKRH